MPILSEADAEAMDDDALTQTERVRLVAIEQIAGAIKDQFESMSDQMQRYEELIIRQAEKEIAGLIPQVLERLARKASLDDFENEGWPYLTPLGKMGFLDHLLWAKFEHHFVHSKDTFEKVVLSECARVVDACLSGIAAEMIFAACRIQRGKLIGAELQNWTAQQLFEALWPELMQSDVSILDDYGIENPWCPREEEDE